MRFYEIFQSLLQTQQKEPIDITNDLLIAPSLLSTWLDGSQLPDYDHVLKLMSYFHVTYDELLGSDAVHIVKPKTATRLYNVDSHYSGLPIKLINVFNVLRMVLITSLMIFTLLTIQEIPNDPLLYSLILPYAIALLLVIVYGYSSLHERKFFKLRSIHFIKRNRVYRTATSIRFCSLFITVGFVTYFFLQTLRDFSSEVLLLYSIAIFILSLSINLLSWIFYQSITLVSVDLFQYNFMHELNYPYQFELKLEHEKKAVLILDQINFSYIRVIYNGIEYFQKTNNIYRVMNNSSMEANETRSYLVGEDMLEIFIRPRFLLPPKISMSKATRIHFVKPVIPFNSFTLSKLIYAFGIFMIFFLLL
jgi:hypothetical protein